MAERLFALLVGINQYPSDVGPLYGCVNDIDQLNQYLRSSGDASALAVEMLKDGEATRANLVRLFRQHLGQARAGDVALFHYSGHGARWSSASAFREFYPDGKDEGLVCIDSRRAGGYDLADKELAVLVHEVASRGVHLAVTLDCCHSGSGTRNADSFRGLRSRVTHEVFDERPLDSYLDGHYAQLQAQGRPLTIPTGRHILLAACERTQQAKETHDNRGVFTATMLDVLERSGGRLSYAELFVRCRAAVRTRVDDQLPQFETYGHFNAWSGFLGRSAGGASRRYGVAHDQGEWRVDCGAIHGLPTEPDRVAELTLYPEDGAGDPAGTATTLQVGAQRSVLQLDFAAAPGTRYRAELTSLPVAPLWVWATPGTPHQAALQAALAADASVGVALTEVPEAARYAVALQGDRLVVTQAGQAGVIQAVGFDSAHPADAMPPLLSVLEQLAQWERGLALANPASELDAGAIDFVCVETAAAGSSDPPTVHPGPLVTLESIRQGAGASAAWADVPAKLQARNRSGQTLHLLLAYFSPSYGVQVLRNDPVPSGDAWVTLYGDGADEFFWVGEDEAESVDRFKLLVSTERVDGFQLELPDLTLGATRAATRALGGSRKIGRKVVGDQWLTRDLGVRTVRRLDELGARDWVSPQGRITVKGHPGVTASISLGAPPSSARGAGGLPFLPAFERAGLQVLNFGGTRGGADTVLELTNIQHPERLKQQPLELVLDVPLADDEGILPFVFDGQHVLLAGQPSRDAQGRSLVSIDHLHDLPTDRRSLGKALKLYFFKIYLHRSQVNRLCWVEYRPDGSLERRQDGLADRVAKAARVVLLVHGIIGDTDGMAAGLRACGLDQRFDLVLTYDYENLGTPIADTARQLKADLLQAGLGPQDHQHLTLLVHSMGGLVSRWFIEREDGRAMVDHLVMCGTPNQGSPFGKVDGARKIFTMLTGLAANVAPALVPFSAPLLFLLNRSAKVTPTLEQMDPASDFIQGLNGSPDPGVRYTVLAGNVDDYDEPSDPNFAKLVTKLGQSSAFGLLFGQRPNDIAVAVESIFGAGAGRAAAGLRPVACHHLNYFSSRAGQAALLAVPW
jgi:Caspase domain